MADSKTSTKTSDKPTEAVDGSDPLGTEKGFIGTAVDQIPNEEYSLESGPDSPSIPEQVERNASA